MSTAAEAPPPAELPPTAWAVLGLLSFERELSGYDLKKWADNSLRFFYWSPAASQIYAELKRLERLGFVTSRIAAQDDLRNKRLFAITPAGLVAIRGWVQHAPVEPPMLKHGVALRAWLGHLADPARLREMVAEHRDNSAALAEEASNAAASAAITKGWEYPALVSRWSQRYFEAEQRLAAEMLNDLDELAATLGDARRRR
ncbi:MAG: transcriptional regulator, PadR-like family [Ilumatobacteraceae bacterium]|nr:transcriptional regulator, PadR-like family [Ilumatobacteraceae bacterium]MCU1389121.1 transcriptional regulator, PadR-like family [Ilumatobacteraceae bacterium]